MRFLPALSPARLAPELGGTHARSLAEEMAEIELAGEVQSGRDLFDGKSGITQQPPRLVQSDPLQEIMQRLRERGFEQIPQADMAEVEATPESPNSCRPPQASLLHRGHRPLIGAEG